MLEVRTVDGLKRDEMRVYGHAALFDSVADLGGFYEVIRHGAFSNSLQSGENIRALAFHDDNALLGTTRAKTLTLKEDGEGLSFELILPNTTHGRDIAELVGRGDIAGCSFGFTTVRDSWQGETRELLEVNLVEITLTPNPAYTDTTVAIRSKENNRPKYQIFWLDTVR